MKKILLLLCLAMTSLIGFAQQNLQDVVYLKNGGIIRGIIIEQIPNKQIKIETSGQNVMVYQMEEIERLTREAIPGTLKSHKQQQSGREAHVELGAAMGNGTNGLDYYKMDFALGYRFSSDFYIGAGTGLHYYSKIESSLFPLFGRLQYNITPTKVTPFISCDLGYSFDPEDDFNGIGTIINPTIGVKFKSTNNSAVFLSLGYESQQFKFEYNYLSYSVNSGAICLTLGSTF